MNGDDPLLRVKKQRVKYAIEVGLRTTVSTIAPDLGVSQQVLNYVATGRTKSCRRSTLEKLARLAGVSVGWLTGEVAVGLVHIPPFILHSGERIEFKNPSLEQWQRRQSEPGQSVADYLMVRMTIGTVSAQLRVNPEMVRDMSMMFDDVGGPTVEGVPSPTRPRTQGYPRVKAFSMWQSWAQGEVDGIVHQSDGECGHCGYIWPVHGGFCFWKFAPPLPPSRYAESA